MSAAPATKGRRIGDIVLELGFASEADLAKANIEHEKTGQPLGQILVELGCITRLELASALAEQWSDQSASIKLLPIPPRAALSNRAPEPHHDDDQYAARLQDAVAELAQRVGAGATQPTEVFDDQVVTDLAERVEATVARTQRIEATLATLAESFEGVTGGVEEAFGALQSGMAGLALDLARIDTTVAELTTHSAPAPETDPALAARLEELSVSVAALTARPVADPEAESRLDALAARVDTLGESDEAGELRAALTAIEGRIAELADRPVADPAEVEGRLGALAARVENIVTPDEVVALHESLVAFEQRLAVLAEDAGSTAALDEQARSLAELRATVVELASRPIGDPELDERLARIETQFAEQLAAKPDAGQIAALAARLESRADEHESLATAVAQLGVRLEEMTRRDEGAARSLEELQERVEAFASMLTDVRQGLTAQEDAAAPQRLDELGQSVTTMRDEVAALAQSIIPADRIEQIAHRVEDLAAEHQAQEALAQRLDEIEGRLATDIVTPEDLARALAEAGEDLTPVQPPLADPRVDELARELASLRDDQAPDPRVDRLTDDLTEVRARLDDLNATAEPVHDPIVHEQLQALTTRLESTIGALTARVDGLADAAAVGAPDTTGPAAEELQRLVDERIEARVAAQVAEQVGELTRGLEDRLAAAEALPRTGGSETGDASELDDLLERNRMTIERLGLHLGEHDRALAELMQTRSLPRKLDELAAWVEEIAGGAPAAGQQAPATRREIGSVSSPDPSTGEVKALIRRVEDAEVASQADREKLMNRLERMAASIDWRLQRLEATETQDSE